MKLTDILKLVKEESVTGGTANATPGTGEQYSTKKAFKKIPKDFKSAPSVPNRKSKAIDYKKMFEVEEEVINENYNRFRNSTKTRPKQDQFHQAVKEVKKKIAEANKLMEYVDRLKNELNEGGDSLKYKKHTTNALSQIKESVVNLYKKVKSFN